MTGNKPGPEHPGDGFARAQIEAFYARNLRTLTRELADATAAAATPSGLAAPQQARRDIRAARRQLEEYEAGYAQWREHATMPWRQIEQFTRVAGTEGDGLGAFFAPAAEVGDEESVTLELLDPDLGAGSAPSAHRAANNEATARNAVVCDAMRRWGWWQPGDPPTPAMHAESAYAMAQEDAWRASVGQPLMWAEEIAEERRAAGAEALAAYAAQQARANATGHRSGPGARPHTRGTPPAANDSTSKTQTRPPGRERPVPGCERRRSVTRAPRTTVTVETTLGTQRTRFEQDRAVYVNVEGARCFYLPDHVGEVVMTDRGYAEVVEVADHECDGIDHCEVEEIELPGYGDQTQAAHHHTPTTTGGTSTMSDNELGFVFSEAAAEMQAAASKYNPDGAMHVLATIEGFPEALTSIAGTFKILAERCDAEFPLHPRVGEALNEVHRLLEQAVPASEEVGRVFRVEHAHDITRIQEPRTGEEMWDVTNNDD